MERRYIKQQVLAFLVVALSGFGCANSIDQMLLRQWDWADYALLDDGKLHVILVGTGIPIPNENRLPACTAIVVDGEVILVDAGPGTIRHADLLGLPITKLRTILTTHFHADHIGGVGDAMSHTWFRGRKQIVDVYGPPGIESIMDGFAAVYAFDTWAKSLPGGDERDPQWQVPAVHEVVLGADSTALVYERGSLRITAFLADHSPIEPAYGYRIDYRGRSVVIAGDNRYNPRIAEFAEDADLLIHPATGVPKFVEERLARLQEPHDLPRVDPELFPSPLQVAQIAEAAGARKLVFSHVPPIDNFLLRWWWLSGIGGVYHGDVVMGEDGMHFVLEPITP